MYPNPTTLATILLLLLNISQHISASYVGSLGPAVGPGGFSRHALITSSLGPDCHDKINPPAKTLESNQCTKFSATTGFVRLFYGYGPYEIGCLDLYSDEECKEDTGKGFGSPHGLPEPCVVKSGLGNFKSVRPRKC